MKKARRLPTGLYDHGADDGVRTRDPDLGKVVLYQLSHVRMGNAFQFSNRPPRKGSEWRRRPDSNRG